MRFTTRSALLDWLNEVYTYVSSFIWQADKPHSCQPFRFWQNSSAFYTIFRHSDRNDQIPQKLQNSVTLILWKRTTRVQGAASAKFISMFTPIFSSSAACNGACDWQACGCWPMSSLDTNVLLFLLDAGEYNILSLQLV